MAGGDPLRSALAASISGIKVNKAPHLPERLILLHKIFQSAIEDLTASHRWGRKLTQIMALNCSDRCHWSHVGFIAEEGLDIRGHKV